jgi:hypothetical protein
MMRVFTDMYQEMQIAISGGVYQSARADTTCKRKGKKLGKKGGKRGGGAGAIFALNTTFFNKITPKNSKRSSEITKSVAGQRVWNLERAERPYLQIDAVLATSGQ